jgi:hypothetical protein
MKKSLKYLLIPALAFVLAGCETYKVDDPELTAVADFDGKWICFAYEASAPATPVTVFYLLVTNTTDGASDAVWMTVTDCDPYVTGDPTYLDALRFKMDCNTGTLAFSCSGIAAEQPRTCPNPYLGQGYYTAGYRNIVPATGYKVTVDGKVTKNGVDTHSGYKADAIEFSYSRTNPDGTVKNYTVKGMKDNGWAEDVMDYHNFLVDEFGM